MSDKVCQDRGEFAEKLANNVVKRSPHNSGKCAIPAVVRSIISPPSYILAGKINWIIFEDAFTKYYCKDNGRPAKPIRLMVGLLILKHLRDISDESVVEQWPENVYYQYFCGTVYFTPRAPCAASDLVHFRHRIGAEGLELILKESIRVNGKDGSQSDLIADTSVQEKNSTFPTDSKLHAKIISKCLSIAEKEAIELRQRYSQTVKKLRQEGRYRHHPKNKKKARSADRKLHTIAGRLVRELERKMNAEQGGKYESGLGIFNRILEQKEDGKNKIYSIHEPDVQCISKGKEHKKYEFGNKVSILTTKDTGVIVGALSLQGNPYDGHTLEPALEQYERIHGHVPKSVTADKGYRGKKCIGATEIHIPKTAQKKMTAYQKRKIKIRFARRASIEPVIAHLKTDYRLSRNYYKGIIGDKINVLLAAAAMNFKRIMNIWKLNLGLFCALGKSFLESFIWAITFDKSLFQTSRKNPTKLQTTSFKERLNRKASEETKYLKSPRLESP